MDQVLAQLTVSSLGVLFLFLFLDRKETKIFLNRKQIIKKRTRMIIWHCYVSCVRVC